MNNTLDGRNRERLAGRAVGFTLLDDAARLGEMAYNKHSISLVLLF